MEATSAKGLTARRNRRRTGERLAPGRLTAVLAFAALVLSVVAAGPGTLPGDVAVTRLVQRASGGTTGEIARFMNALGETPVMLALGMGIVLALLARRRTDAALLLVAAMLMRFANPVLKTLFASPRPTADGGVRLEEIASGFGFPSGHVMGMTLFVGALVCLVWQTHPRRRTRLAAASSAGVVLLASGFGRIAVGAHWPSDVLGGYLWGGLGVAGLAWCWRAAPRLDARQLLVETRAIGPAEGVSVMASAALRRWRIGALVLGGVMAMGVVWATDATQTTTEATEQSARIIAGTCADAGAAAAYELDAVGPNGANDEGGNRDDAPRGDAVGAAGAVPVPTFESRIDVSLETLLAQPHAIVVTAGAADAPVVACGEIGGQLRDDDDPIIGLTPAGDAGTAGTAGIAFLNDEDDGQAVEVTLYLVAWDTGIAATPVA